MESDFFGRRVRLRFSANVSNIESYLKTEHEVSIITEYWVSGNAETPFSVIPKDQNYLTYIMAKY